jgi:hypothetical protein
MTVDGALVSVFRRFSANKLTKFCTSSLLMKMISLLPRFKKKRPVLHDDMKEQRPALCH